VARLRVPARARRRDSAHGDGRYSNSHGFIRADTYPDDGGPPGSDIGLFDRWLDEDAGASTPNTRVRREVRWLRRLPGEYFADYVWVNTQPLELPPRRDQLVELLSWFGREDKLVFSSDCPHWDTDDVDYREQRFPATWHERVSAAT
jgi:hypothetical protein